MKLHASPFAFALFSSVITVAAGCGGSTTSDVAQTGSTGGTNAGSGGSSATAGATSGNTGGSTAGAQSTGGSTSLGQGGHTGGATIGAGGSSPAGGSGGSSVLGVGGAAATGGTESGGGNAGTGTGGSSVSGSGGSNSMSCPPAIPTGTCSVEGTSCPYTVGTCGEAFCTCSQGQWQCAESNGPNCMVCPAQVMDGTACAIDEQECPDACGNSCACDHGGWACLGMCTPEPCVDGGTCSGNAGCEIDLPDGCSRSCSCSASGTYTCVDSCASSCPTGQTMACGSPCSPQGASCFCTYGSPVTVPCTCDDTPIGDQWSCDIPPQMCPTGIFHVGDACTGDNVSCQCATTQSGPTEQCTCNGGVWNACPLTMPQGGPCTLDGQTCDYGNFASCTCSMESWLCAL